MDTDNLLKIVEELAGLGESTEDMGNECFLCDYQPAHGRRIQEKKRARDEGFVARRIKDDKYPHEGHEDCIIARAMRIIKELDGE